MRSTIQKILKESRDYHVSVFLIMSEDEKFVKYNLHVAGENYFSGGPNEDGWESIDKLNDKTFQEFYFNQRKNPEGIISILPQTQLDRYKPKVIEYVMGYFRKDDMNNVFDQLSESVNVNLGSIHNPKVGDFILAKKIILIDGKERATTVGSFYRIEGVRNEYGIKKVVFKNDNDDGHTVTPTNDFFKNHFDYVPEELRSSIDNVNFFDRLSESLDDDFEWARDVINTPSDKAVIGQTYRVNLPEEEKAIIDVIITDISNFKVYDNCRAIIYDTVNTTILDQEEFLQDYNRSGDTTELSHVNHLIKSGHWIPIKLEDSLFKDEKFIHVNIRESEENDLGDLSWARDVVFNKEYDKVINGEDMGDQIKSSVKKIVFIPSVKVDDYILKDVLNILKKRGFKLYTPQLPRRRSDLDILPNLVGDKKITCLFLNNREDSSVTWSALENTPSLLKDRGTYSAEEFVNNFKNELNESEENEFDWVDDTSNEPFHHILMRDKDRKPLLMDEIHTIMFNPPVTTEDKRFLDIAYWLEDHDYYPERIEFGKKTSYIEMVKQRDDRGSGRWKIGPELSDEELYKFSQTPKRGEGKWNGNFWAEQFMKRFNIK